MAQKEEEFNMIFKVVLIGDSGVGKTNIMSRYIKDEFSIETKTTVGVEFGAKKLEINGNSIKAQIWDTAGQERYKSITNAYYKGAKGALIVYDITRPSSFENVDKWISELKAKCEADVTIIMIGNKCDLESERQVSKEAAAVKAQTHGKIAIYLGVAYMETSALQSINIDKAFRQMIEEIFNKNHKNIEEDDDDLEVDFSKGQNLNLKNNTPKNDEKKCC